MLCILSSAGWHALRYPEGRGRLPWVSITPFAALRACHPISLIACVLLVFCLVGCGSSGPTLYALEGAVNYMGKPVKAGTIRFEPVGDKIDPRASPEEYIKDGRYKLTRAKGVAGGKYTVYILAGDGNAKTAPDGTVNPYGNVLFPPYYVTQVDLPKEGGTKDFDIPQQGKTR